MKKTLIHTGLALSMLSTLHANTTRVCDLDMVHYMKTDERKKANEKEYLSYEVKDKQLHFTVQKKSSFVAKLDDVMSDSKIYQTDKGIRVVVYNNQQEVKLITDAMTAFLISCRPTN